MSLFTGFIPDVNFYQFASSGVPALFFPPRLYSLLTCAHWNWRQVVSSFCKVPSFRVEIHYA